jgi:hypothetical protein
MAARGDPLAADFFDAQSEWVCDWIRSEFVLLYGFPKAGWSESGQMGGAQWDRDWSGLGRCLTRIGTAGESIMDSLIRSATVRNGRIS